MGMTIDCLAIDCANPRELARFWVEALDYAIQHSDDPDEQPIVPRNRLGTRLLFLRVPEGKRVKNRLHLDLRPADQAAEVERLTRLGARRVDIGQGNPSWVVLADPEGNEFCVLRALTAEERTRAAAEGTD
jgi:Glyoxalase-like domain